MDNSTNKESICWSCKRSFMDSEGKLGLCPNCINKFGTPAAGVGVAIFGLLGRLIIKNIGKILKL